MRALHLCFASLALIALAPIAAHAAPVPRSFVRLLHREGRPHPLADARGLIPFTARLPRGVTARSLGLVEVAEGLGAARLSPSALLSFEAAHPGVALSFGPPLRPLLNVSAGTTRATAFRNATGADGTGVAVGVIDTGIDVAHPDFRTQDGKTRIAWLLVAQPPAGLHPELEDAFGCTDPDQTPCAIFAAADIDAMLAKGQVTIQDPNGHGTHVTSIAAGNGGPSAGPTKFVGVAPGATLIIASPSEPGGFYDPDVLKGAAFVFDRADALGMPIALNISLGGDYGAHDGTSDLERGLASFVGDLHPGRVIVTAAGNSGDLYDLGDGVPAGIHTEVNVSPGGVVRAPILASAASDARGYVWVTFQPDDDVSVALEGPGGKTWVGFVGKGDRAGYEKDGNTAVVVNNSPEANSGIASDTNSAVIAWTGKWEDGEFTVLLKGKGHASLWVVGTNVTGPGGSPGLIFERGMRRGTVAVPASSPSLLAVGCTVNRVSWTALDKTTITLSELGPDKDPVADSACFFSGTGPNALHVPKPEISAPGGFVSAAMSDAADPRVVMGGLFDSSSCPDQKPCFVIDNRHAIAAGTSMSSPHVAGAAALLLQLDPTLTQARITEVLQAGARRPKGHIYDPVQLGPGSLDLEGARAALAEERLAFADADPAASWFTLSADYLEPDPSINVWGTIELRRADASIASGLDGSKIDLVVNGAAITRTVSKIRHGLFRFAIAGLDGTVGNVATVEVRYGGVSLGTLNLPIGTDRWNATSAPSAEGGLRCEASRGGSPAGMLAIAAIAAAWAWRRRRANSA